MRHPMAESIVWKIPVHTNLLVWWYGRCQFLGLFIYFGTMRYISWKEMCMLSLGDVCTLFLQRKF